MTTIAACLIVRDGAATLKRCLASVRPHVDEVCVYLAGQSTDGTPRLLERLACGPDAPIRVEQGEWRDDYAAARNASFAMATSDYVTWLDDDEVFLGASRLRRLVEGRPDALRIRRVEIVDDDEVSTWFGPRVVRRALGAVWWPPVHERLTLPPDATEDVVSPTDVEVVHHPLPQNGRHHHCPLVESVLADIDDVELRIYLGRYRLYEDGNAPAAAVELRRVIGDHRATAAQKARAAHYLSVALWRLGDVAGAEFARLETRRLSAVWRLGRPRISAACEELERRHPITSEHPVWAIADEVGTLGSLAWESKEVA